MIEKLTDIGVLSGVSSPLLPLLYADFRYASNDIDGIYVQHESKKIKSFISVKNRCATVCVTDDDFSFDEINSFFTFLHIGQVLSNFCLGEGYRKIPFLHTNPKPCNDSDLVVTSPLWKMSQYKSLHRLLADGKESFDTWFTDFSRRVNDGFALGVCDKDYYSCAVAPCVYNGVGVIAGVFTDPQHRGQGRAQRCIMGLLGALYDVGIRNVFLWCNEDKVTFYEKTGFKIVENLYIREEM